MIRSKLGAALLAVALLAAALGVGIIIGRQHPAQPPKPAEKRPAAEQQLSPAQAERLRLAICLLLDQLGRDSTSQADYIACG